MSNKTKMRLSGNSIAWAGSFVNHTKTNHSFTYIRKVCLFLDTGSFYGMYYRGTCERNIFC